jgi:beta-lactam-binding protein with PASTA domain
MLVGGKALKQGAKISKGSTITLVLGQGLSNETISAPYLIGLPYEEAVVKIREEYHLSLGAVTAADGMSEAEKSRAFVYKQDPAYGHRIHVGEEIDLWVAKELPEGITIRQDLYNKGVSDTTE